MLFRRKIPCSCVAPAVSAKAEATRTPTRTPLFPEGLARQDSETRQANPLFWLSYNIRQTTLLTARVGWFFSDSNFKR